jgi:[ribosomal protein S5]-alanine N-acetyltransferase
MSLPVFETERLILRGPTLRDAPAYEKNFVDYEVIRSLAAAVPWPYPKNGVVTWIEGILKNQAVDRWVWGIFLKSNPAELIGVIDLWREATPENRGFWLGKKYWGQGIMTEATGPVMDYAFDVLGFEKMILANAVGNPRSRRVKEKNGARLLRIEPAKFVDPQLTCGHEIWELTKEAWKNR